MRLLQSAGAKLLKPKLVRAASSVAQGRYLAEKHAKSTMSLEERFKAEVKERELLSVEAVQGVARVRRPAAARRGRARRGALADQAALQEPRRTAAEVASEKGTTLANAKVAMSAEDAGGEERAQAKRRGAAQGAAEASRRPPQEAAGGGAQYAHRRSSTTRGARSPRSRSSSPSSRPSGCAMVRKPTCPRNVARSRGISRRRKGQTEPQGRHPGRRRLRRGEAAAPQIKEALQKNADRVLDLFREWDANGDGQVSKKEFRKAMPLLGIDLPVKAIDELFDQHDPDKSGVMELNELQKMLDLPRRRRAKAAAAFGKAKNATAAASKMKALAALKK